MKRAMKAAILCILFHLISASCVVAAGTPQQKCQAGKTVEAAKYAACLTKAEAKRVVSGDSAKYDATVAKCVQKLSDKYESLENKAVAAGTTCPTRADSDSMEKLSTKYAGVVSMSLGGERYVDNGDGTISDRKTGLMWEKKSNDGGIHDKDNTYTWSASGSAPYPPSGTAFAAFLATLNGGTGACFAGHCDWRLPTVEELEGLLLEPDPCGTNPCVDAAFNTNCSGSCSVTACSCTQSYIYWSASTYGPDPYLTWGVDFIFGQVAPFDKTLSNPVRAVRGGS